jgi:hypothetical protein
MTIPTRRSTILSILLGLVLATSLAACASTERGADTPTQANPDDVLLTSSGGLELHLRGGRVLEVEPATATREDTRVRQLKSLDELRASWQQVAAEPLPRATPGGSVQVNGWVGLECVRLGKACGRPPDDAPRAMVVIRFD